MELLRRLLEERPCVRCYIEELGKTVEVVLRLVFLGITDMTPGAST